MPLFRLRLAVAVVSMAVIGLELALRRALSLRFWHHFAYMVISVALLGFGASGTALTLLREKILPRWRTWLWCLALLFSLSMLLAPRAAQQVPLDVHFLAWNLSQVGNVLAVEALMFVPFFLAGAVIGIALMDRPENIAGHYAANLVGSGLGAVLTVLAMQVLSTAGLFTALAGLGFVGAAGLVPWRRASPALTSAGAAVAILLLCWLAPWEPTLSQYKMLSYFKDLEGTKIIHQTEGPLGRVDVVEGPAVRHAPGLKLGCSAPPHVVLVTDGDQLSSVFDCPKREDWAFMDQTTRTAPYHLFSRPRSLIIGAGGGADIGLALYHRSSETVALEMNPQIIAAMTGPLRHRGGSIYLKPSVTIINRQARGYLAATDREFDVIQVPPVGAFAASGAGLYATQECYLYTVESFHRMLEHLSGDGVLCITRWALPPPRTELRALDTAAAALRELGLDPAAHLAMIRNWATATVLAFNRPVTAEQAATLQNVCEQRHFDICYLPRAGDPKVNYFHQLPRPYYHEAAIALLSRERDAFLEGYLFDVRATTDDRPYFFHTLRWQLLPVLAEQVGGRTPAFLELGYLMSVAALAQGVLGAVVLILLPLLARVRSLLSSRRKAAVFGYFLLLGLSFMLLEMGFLQKFILYLAHPIYSAAGVIGGFLVFSGLGSYCSRLWRARPKRIITLAAAAIVLLSLAYFFLLDDWLALTLGRAMPLRFAVACVTVAPLAFAMGHMFPAGLRQVSANQPPLVPWAWGVNGFASVAATVGTPLLATEAGFGHVIFLAVLCYAVAGAISRWLPEK